MTTATVHAYVDAVNAGDLEPVLRLFAPGAVVHHPAGTFEGDEAIRGFYRDLILAGQTALRLGRVLAGQPDGTDDDERLVAFELEATSPLAEPGAAPLHALDVAALDGDGRIVVLDVYYR